MLGATATPNVSANAAQSFIAFSSWFRRRRKQVLCRASNSWNISWLVGPAAQPPAVGAEGLTSTDHKGRRKDFAAFDLRVCRVRTLLDKLHRETARPRACLCASENEERSRILSS